MACCKNAIENTDSFTSWVDYLRNRQTIIDDENLNSSRLIAEEYDSCSEEVVLDIHEYIFHFH